MKKGIQPANTSIPDQEQLGRGLLLLKTVSLAYTRLPVSMFPRFKTVPAQGGFRHRCAMVCRLQCSMGNLGHPCQ